MIDNMYEAPLNQRISELTAENERLRAPWRNVDAIDWAEADKLLGDGGRGKFWKEVLAEMRVALEHKG